MRSAVRGEGSVKERVYMCVCQIEMYLFESQSQLVHLTACLSFSLSLSLFMSLSLSVALCVRLFVASAF